MAELVRSLGGRIREVRLDAPVAPPHAATVEAQLPHGVELVDARSSDALTLAVLAGRADPLVASEMLDDSEQCRRTLTRAQAVLMRGEPRSAPPMTITKAEP